MNKRIRKKRVKYANKMFAEAFNSVDWAEYFRQDWKDVQELQALLDEMADD